MRLLLERGHPGGKLLMAGSSRRRRRTYTDPRGYRAQQRREGGDERADLGSIHDLVIDRAIRSTGRQPQP